MSVTVYVSGQTFSNQVRNEQRTILDFLRGNKIEHTTVDVSQNPAARKELVAGLDEDTHCTGLAPMIFSGDTYLGQFTEFFNAKEADTLYQFFQMEPPVDSREKAVWDRANKPPTPEPEPEPEVEEAEEPAEGDAEEGETVAEGDEAAGLPEGYPEEPAEEGVPEDEEAAADEAEVEAEE